MRCTHRALVRLQIPCRILGDPLQGIFDFDGQPIDWHRDIESAFERFGELDTPHRWRLAGSPALGDWLRDVRGTLESRQSIDLPARPPERLRITDR